VDGHQEPFVVVLAPLEELLTEPVLLNPEEFEVSEEDEVLDVSVEVVVPDVPDPLAVEAATVPVWLDAYASARWRPNPPAVSVVARSTPAVQRRVVDRARLVRRLVMRATLPGAPRPILCTCCDPAMTVGAPV
jgi:hypothetical protein